MKDQIKTATAAIEEIARLEAAHAKVLAERDAAVAAIPLGDEALTRAQVELRLGEREQIPEALRTAATDARQAVGALTAEADELAKRLDACDAKIETAADALRLAARPMAADAAARLAEARAKAVGPLAAALRRCRLATDLAGVQEPHDLGAVFHALLNLGVAAETLIPDAADDSGMHQAVQLHATLRSALSASTERRRAEALRARREGGA